jgi:hypothetical protein
MEGRREANIINTQRNNNKKNNTYHAEIFRYYTHNKYVQWTHWNLRSVLFWDTIWQHVVTVY